MIALLVITDGRREHIGATLDAASEHLHGPVTRRLIYDDSGDPENLAWLRSMFPLFEVWQHPEGRQGFGGAIREAWRRLAEVADIDYVFHLEDDFTITRPVDLWQLAGVLDENPHLIQLALRRQPWNEAERAAGGIVEQHPDDWHERELVGPAGVRSVWLESRRNFTTNPCLYRRDLLDLHPWPSGEHSEGRYGIGILEQLAGDVRPFGYWGARSSGVWCEHTGHTRAGTGY